jgi:hypothetical protein
MGRARSPATEVRHLRRRFKDHDNALRETRIQFGRLKALVWELLATGGPLPDTNDPQLWTDRYLSVVARVRAEIGSAPQRVSKP